MVPMNSYVTLILKGIGFDTVSPPLSHSYHTTTHMKVQFTTNLLIIPYNVGHILLLLTITYISEYLNERALVTIFQPI